MSDNLFLKKFITIFLALYYVSKSIIIMLSNKLTVIFLFCQHIYRLSHKLCIVDQIIFTHTRPYKYIINNRKNINKMIIELIYIIVEQN